MLPVATQISFQAPFECHHLGNAPHDKGHIRIAIFYSPLEKVREFQTTFEEPYNTILPAL